MSYNELYTKWVAINHAINAGALHETAADEVLQDMVVAYCEQRKIDSDNVDFSDIFDAIVNENNT